MPAPERKNLSSVITLASSETQPEGSAFRSQTPCLSLVGLFAPFPFLGKAPSALPELGAKMFSSSLVALCSSIWIRRRFWSAEGCPSQHFATRHSRYWLGRFSHFSERHQSRIPPPGPTMPALCPFVSDVPTTNQDGATRPCRIQPVIKNSKKDR